MVNYHRGFFLLLTRFDWLTGYAVDPSVGEAQSKVVGDVLEAEKSKGL